MTPEREAKFKRVVRARQANLTVILENVHDSHNIGAVLRTCDSVGVGEIFVLYSDPRLSQNELSLGKRTSSGARKWVDVHFYKDIDACFKHVRSKYEQIWATHLSGSSQSLFDLDLTQSIAFLFGNEKNGLSQEVLAYADANFLVPQVGMAESLNISVACAVSLYEAYRQRNSKGWYEDANPSSKQFKKALLEEYYQRHDSRESPIDAKLIR